MMKQNNNLSAKYRYLFFDLDGTVTDPMQGITRSVDYALNHFGIVVNDLRELCPFIGPPLKDSFMEFYQFTEAQAEEAVKKYRERNTLIPVLAHFSLTYSLMLNSTASCAF